jgi:hypothetical protein
MLIGDIEHEGPFPRYTQHVDAGKVLEHPASGGILGRLPFLVGEGGLEVYEPLPTTLFQGRIDEQAHGPHH